MLNPQPSDGSQNVALSTEARTIIAQLKARMNIDNVTVERGEDDTRWIATASGTTEGGDSLLRMATEGTPEDALVMLLAGYRVLDRHKMLRSIPGGREE